MRKNCERSKSYVVWSQCYHHSRVSRSNGSFQEMQKNQAFRDYRVARAIELAQRNIDALESDGESEEVNFLLSQYIGELYSWQEDGEAVEPEVKRV